MRHLPSLFVILLSTLAATMTLLWWEGRQARADLASQNSSLLADVERQVATLNRENDQRHRWIMRELTVIASRFRRLEQAV